MSGCFRYAFPKQTRPVVNSDTGNEYVRGNDDDWEDAIESEESEESEDDKNLFQRVPFNVNLTSRLSLISLMVSSWDSQSTLVDFESNTPTNGSSLSSSSNDSDEDSLTIRGTRQSTILKPIIKGAPRSSAQPIAAAGSYMHIQAVLSPRTTRHTMLATELPESLRRHLLWERQQKSSAVNAVLKRRPDRPCVKRSKGINASSLNQYFTKLVFNDYYSKGW